MIGIIFLFILVLLNKKEVYFSLNGKEYIEVNIGSKYKDEGFKAEYCSKYLKLFCKDISDSVKITKNIKSSSHYFMNYSINYKNTNKVLTREVRIHDTESPTIELIEDKNSICPNGEYKEAGFKAYDNVDGDITKKVKSVIKDNKVYYTVSDSSGNKKTIYRNIKYKDDEAPKITLSKDTEYVFKNSNYISKEYKAYDNCDGDISDKVIIEKNINTNKAGEYEIIYSVSDSSGNKSSVSKKVIVYDDKSKIPKNGKVVYLTFDDGPGSYTEDILKVLDKYNVKATFFVTNQFSSYQNLLKKEYDNGHTVAVHTYSHNYDTIYESVDAYINDFNNMNQIIFEQTGYYTKIFRFPGGSSNTISRFNKGIMTNLSKKMTELGYIYYDWNVDSEDTRYDDPNIIKDNVIKGMESNQSSVVLMHDIKKANIESVDLIIRYGLENGYTFLPIKDDTPVVHHSINN